MKDPEIVEVQKWEEMIKWFEKNYKGRPMELDIRNEDGSYRCTIVFGKKEVN